MRKKAAGQTETMLFWPLGSEKLGKAAAGTELDLQGFWKVGERKKRLLAQRGRKDSGTVKGQCLSRWVAMGKACLQNQETG